MPELPVLKLATDLKVFPLFTSLYLSVTYINGMIY